MTSSVSCKCEWNIKKSGLIVVELYESVHSKNTWNCFSLLENKCLIFFFRFFWVVPSALCYYLSDRLWRNKWKRFQFVEHSKNCAYDHYFKIVLLFVNADLIQFDEFDVVAMNVPSYRTQHTSNSWTSLFTYTILTLYNARDLWTLPLWQSKYEPHKARVSCGP